MMLLWFFVCLVFLGCLVPDVYGGPTQKGDEYENQYAIYIVRFLAPPFQCNCPTSQLKTNTQYKY